MYRLLKTGGRLYLLDPTVDNWVIRQIAKFMHLFIRDKVNLYTSKEFRIIITRAGFNYIGTEKIKFNQKVQVGEK